MVSGPESLERLHQARQENRVHPVRDLVDGIEAQIDEDLTGGWGDMEEEFLDGRDPRRLRIRYTVELDTALTAELDELEPDRLEVVQRELQRRYLDAGFHGLSFVDEGRVSLEYDVGPDAGDPSSRGR